MDIMTVVFVFIFSTCCAQLKFGGSSGSSGSTSSNTKQSQTDTRFLSTGNQAIDGGILGIGAGLLGGAVLSGALNGGGNNGCGRRRRQADGTNTKFLELCLEEDHQDAIVEGREDKLLVRISMEQGSLD